MKTTTNRKGETTKPRKGCAAPLITPASKVKTESATNDEKGKNETKSGINKDKNRNNGEDGTLRKLRVQVKT